MIEECHIERCVYVMKVNEAIAFIEQHPSVLEEITNEVEWFNFEMVIIAFIIIINIREDSRFYYLLSTTALRKLLANVQL